MRVALAQADVRPERRGGGGEWVENPYLEDFAGCSDFTRRRPVIRAIWSTPGSGSANKESA